MNKDRILKLADQIETAELATQRRTGFNMVSWFTPAHPTGAPDHSGHECGTVACIAGTACLANNLDYSFGWGNAAGAFLGLTVSERHALFIPIAKPLGDITVPEAVACLRILANTGKVDWKAAIECVANSTPVAAE